MKCKIEKGNLFISVHELLETLGEDDIDKLADNLSCTDMVIKNVVAQILDGWTEMGSHGGTCAALPAPFTPLDRAIREVAKRSGEVAEGEIKRLEEGLQREIRQCKKHTHWAYALCLWIQDGMIGKRPDLEDIE